MEVSVLLIDYKECSIVLSLLVGVLCVCLTMGLQHTDYEFISSLVAFFCLLLQDLHANSFWLELGFTSQRV